MDSNGYPYLNIELGKELAVNHINKLFIGESQYKLSQSDLDIIYHLGRIFYYKTAIIFHHFINFSMFKNNYTPDEEIFLHMRLFNESIYSYLKTGKTYLDFDSFVNYETGYWYLDEYFNKPISDNISSSRPANLNNIKTNKDLLIRCIEILDVLKFYMN